MKYKKRSLKNKQRQRHRFSKKYATAVTVQRGGGFMDVIPGINAMEGRTNTCMAVHPTQPLVAVGDDSGIVTLWDLGQAQPKKLAQLIGLPTAVKCVEFHPTLSVVAAACSDRVLMWRVDQISREQMGQEVEPSHTVSVFGLRDEKVVEQELRDMEQNFEEADRTLKALYREQVTINNNLREIDKKMRDINDDKGINGYPGFTRGADHLEAMLKRYTSGRNREMELETLTKLQPLRQKLTDLKEEEVSLQSRYKESKTRSDSINTFDKELKIKALERELKLIRIQARDEVSCIAFRPGSVFPLYKNASYIAVGVNNDKNKTENRIIMYRFEIEPSSVEKLYHFSPFLRGESIPAVYPDVSLMSFSHNGALFAFVTKSLDGRTVLKVRKDSEYYYSSECGDYKIERSIISIRSYKSPYQYYRGGTEYQHQFIIGCNDGSLTMIQATTEDNTVSVFVRNLKSIREWNARGKPIKCVAVHPSLPLFASGIQDFATLWDINEPDALESIALQDIKSVGFNQNFLAVCGPRSMRFYSCNPDDYRDFNEKSQKESKFGAQVAEFVTDVTLANRQGDPCSICNEPMNNPLTQSVLRSGPEDAVEEQLACGHTFHKKCIQPWIKQGKPCPLCRAEGVLVKATPQRILNLRQKFMETNIKDSIIDTNRERFMRVLDFGKGPIAQGPIAQGPIAQGSPLGLIRDRNQGNQPTPGSFPHHQGSPLRLIQARNPVQQQASDSFPLPQGSPLGLIRDRNQGNQPMPGSSPQRNLFPDLDPGQEGGSKNKYSRKKNNSKKLKFRRRYSKKI